MSEEITPSKKEIKIKRKEAKRLQKNKRELLEVSTTCINCESQLALDNRFCPKCGGKRIYNRITWRNLLEDFVDRFLNIENSFIKTFISLFKRPEDVVVGFMDGMRKKYMTAFSYFAVALAINGVYNFILRNWLKENLLKAQSSLFVGEQAEFQEAFASDWFDLVLEYQSLVMFLSIPLLALISRTVFWNYKKYNLVEHLVIWLYSYSHISIVMVVLTIASSWNTLLMQIVNMISFLWMFLFSAYVLKRVFDLDWARLILKTFLFVLMFFVLTIGAGIGFGIYIGKQLAEGTLKDTPFNNIIKESFEKGRKSRINKIEKDSLLRLQDSLKNEKTFVVDSLVN